MNSDSIIQFLLSASNCMYRPVVTIDGRQHLRALGGKQRDAWNLEIIAAHSRTRGTYGAECLQEDLAAHGIEVGIHRIKKIRLKLGIKCKQKKKFKATTNSEHNLPVAAILLEQMFQANKPGQIWLTDITYIATDEGWLYLAGYKDIFTGEIVGYAISDRMMKDFVIKALFLAVSTKRPDKGLILHSDRGSQYCS